MQAHVCAHLEWGRGTDTCAADSRFMKNPRLKKPRHTTVEIAAKLNQADAMSAEGRLQADIAQALGVSVMTYHRWRKARSQPGREVGPRHSSELGPSPIDQAARISELQLENSRLRRLVTDLLLEKMNLEEDAHDFLGKKDSALE